MHAAKAPVRSALLTAREHRTLMGRLGAERAVPAVAIGILAVATALSSAPSLGPTPAIGGPTGDGAVSRVAVGGGLTPAVDDAQGAVSSDLSGVIDSSAAIGPEDLVATEPAGEPVPEERVAASGSYLQDGTILKPVAVDTTVSDGKGLMRSYRVRPGDTLTGIARKHSVSMMTVWWANNLTSKSDLTVGQTLTIPPVNGLVITVGATDTLEALAAKYGVEASEIVDANKLDDPNLVIGQTLTVPGARGDRIVVPKAQPKPRASTGSGGGTKPRPRPPPTYSGGAFAWPVAGGHISQYYHYGHYGIDIAADRGTPVKAAARGTVIFAGWKSNGGGYQVWIGHGSGLYTTYNHMSGVSVGRGQSVSRGQRVGRVGSTGYATGPHLHFEVWKGPVWDGGRRVNPLAYL